MNVEFGGIERFAPGWPFVALVKKPGVNPDFLIVYLLLLTFCTLANLAPVRHRIAEAREPGSCSVHLLQGGHALTSSHWRAFILRQHGSCT